MNSLEFEKRTAQRKLLSAVDVLGTFDFATAVINLKSIVTADVDGAKKALAEFKPGRSDKGWSFLSGEQFLVLAKCQPLAVHEYTHFVDATSTLWGFRHLNLMRAAYESNGADEKEYHKAKEFADHVRGIKLPSYYTTIYKSHEQQPWQSRITIGRIFGAKGDRSSRSVLFSQFLNSDNEIMVRSPVSTVSILEASAVAQDTMCLARLLQLTNPEYRLVEDREFQRKTMGFIYSKNITEYSVCIHILANCIGCSDLLVASAICARLLRLALNFPKILFNKLAENCPIEKILNIPDDHEFGEAIRDGLRHHDLGIIYYLLCNALPKDIVGNEDRVDPAIATALQLLGTSLAELTTTSEEEAQYLIKSIEECNIESIKTLAHAGLENYKTIGFQVGELDFRKLNLPPALLGDDKIVNILFGEKNSLSNFDVEGCFFELDDGMSWVNVFSEACL